jgi:hypothetical protein
MSKDNLVEKLNQDGLVPGSLVTPKQLADVKRQRQQAERKKLTSK